MITISNRLQSFSTFMLIVLALACSSDLSDDPIPLQNFSPIELNLSLPQYIALQSTGNYFELNDGPIKGLILYRRNNTSVIAYNRNCSFQPLNACATVNVHTSGLYMNDACCGSTFRFDDGAPNGGPAWRPLVQYNTSLSGNTLIITDQVIN